MKFRSLAIAGAAAALALPGVAASATEPANMQDREEISETKGIAVDYDLSAGVENVTAVVVDAATEEKIVDVSTELRSSAIEVTAEGKVTKVNNQ